MKKVKQLSWRFVPLCLSLAGLAAVPHKPLHLAVKNSYFAFVLLLREPE